MSIFASQFDRARVYTGLYTGPPDDTTWRTPRGAASGGFRTAGAVTAMAAGGVVAALAAAAIDAFFDTEAGTSPHPDSHADPHTDTAAHAQAGPDSAPAHEPSGAEPASSGGPDAGGGNVDGHANAWGTSWGHGWENGWDAESGHQLASGGHAAAASAGSATGHLQEASGQAAHQLFAESTDPGSVHDSPHGSEPASGSAAAHAAPEHVLHLTGTESPSDDGSAYDRSGYDAFAHEGSGYDHLGPADQHVDTGHEDAWAHEAGHTDVGFGGDDGDQSSHHGAF